MTIHRESTRHIRLVTDRPVEQFLLRLFLRDADLRSLSIVSPFISSARFDPARHAAFDPYAPAFLARCAATRAGKASG